jgi:hypothetical protein
MMTRYAVPLGLLLVVCPSLAEAQTNAKEKETTSGALSAKVKDIAADLKEARDLLKGVADKTTRDRLELLITRSELRAVELEKSLAGGAPAATAAPPLSAEDFANLTKSLKAESFDEGKASFVALFAQKGRLTCEQAREILKAFSFDDDRVKSAVLLYPRVTDPENFFKVLDVFSFSSSKDEVRKKLGVK